MGFGTRLKLIRSFTPYTQENVATHFNIASDAYRHYESGYRNPKTPLIKEFAVFYGVASFLLDPNNWSYVPLETKGDLAALIIEGIKRGLIEITGERESDQKRIANGQAKLIFPASLAVQFRLTKIDRTKDYLDTNLITKHGQHYYALAFSDPEIEKMVCDWLLVWEQGDDDKSDRYQIEFAMNKTPLENPEAK